MKVLILLMLTSPMLLIKTDGSLVLDNNSFLIYDKVYHKARLTQWDTGYYDVGTCEHAIYSDQLWTLEPHPSKEGCYYIMNEKHSQYRIANYRHSFVVYDGPHYNDQLFKSVHSGNNDGSYYIYSCSYTNDRIAIYGSGDSDVRFFDPMDQNIKTNNGG